MTIINVESVVFDVTNLNFKTTEIERHRGMIANVHIKIGSNSYENVKT